MKCFLFLLVFAFFIPNAFSQSVPVQTEPVPDQCNNIREYLICAAAKITDNRFNGINTREDWEQIKPDRYKQLVEMLSIQDMPLNKMRPQLNVKVTGTIQKKGYRIKKLYYESLPGLYVPANLYIPDNINNPRPAILYVCGHAETQKVYYQEHPRKFAQLGFVCLIVETIQRGEIRGEHHGCYANGWFNWYSRGYTPGGVELWNGIRAIDLLETIPEVDKERIGVTGNSGGGVLSWYIPAIDQRVKAAAPSCGASTLKAHLLTRSIDRHCDCMMPINTYGWDFQDIGALIAPRPLLVAQSDHDPYSQIESVRQIHQDLDKIYQLYDKTDNNQFIEYYGKHGYQPISRKAIFSFFLKQLMNKDVSPEEVGDTDRSPEASLSWEDLEVYVDGPPADDLTTTIQDSFIELPEKPVITSNEELLSYKDTVVSFLKMRTFGAFPEVEASLSPKMIQRMTGTAEYGNEIYTFVSEEGWRLKMDIHWKNDPHKKSPLMIVLRNQEEEKNESESFANQYIDDQWNVALLEIRGVGETGWPASLQWHVRRASAWTGRTIASMQVYDLLRSIKFSRSLKGIDPSKIGIAARNEMGVVALYSALLDGNCHTLILENPPESQDTPSQPNGRGPATEMLNCLRITDVNQIPALLPAVDITFIDTIPSGYHWSENIRKKLGGKGFNLHNSKIHLR